MIQSSKNKLNNGMPFYNIPLPNTHSVVLSLYVRAGIKYEDKQHTGVSHLIEHLLFRRLHDLNQQQLYYQMECMGTTLMATTYKDFIRFYIEVLPKHVLKAFELIYKLLLENHWTSEDIRMEKAVVINQIEERQFTYSDQSDLDYWKNTPLSNLIMGTKSKVKALSSKTISNYYNRFFQPQNCCFVVSGNIEATQVDFMQRKLNELNNQDTPLLNYPIFSQRFAHRDAYNDLIYDIDSEYADVKLCFEVNYDDVSPELAEYLHSILGDGLGSRLSVLLREKNGMVDEIYSKFERYDGFGVLAIHYDVLSDRLIDSLDQVFTVITALKQNVAGRDIDTSLPFLADNWELFYDFPESLNFHYGWRSYLLGEPFITLEELADKFRGISVKQLKNAASKLFVSENMVNFIYNSNAIQKNSLVEKQLKKWRNSL